MIKELHPQATSRGVTNFAINQSDNKNLFVIAANTEKTIVVPVGYTTASITSNLGVYFMAVSTSAITYPSADALDTNLQFSPAVRKVKAGETLRFIANAAGFLQVDFYL